VLKYNKHRDKLLIEYSRREICIDAKMNYSRSLFVRLKLNQLLSARGIVFQSTLKRHKRSSYLKSNSFGVHLCLKMFSSTCSKKFENLCDLESTLSYEDCIEALNELQSNASVIEKNRRDRLSNASINLIHTSHYLRLCSISDEDIKSLNVIHIAGTKGKGSTAAFTESILRNHGCRTGFFSSPHLVEVRERIRIDGVPLSKEQFAKNFCEVYSKLKSKNCESRANGIPELPPYFRFLTLLAIYTFMQEKVDVAVVEVGIGGEYDCTNVIKYPRVVGVTSLGIDHVAILGNTIDMIAWQKAGIFKQTVPAFTVQQDNKAMKVLKNRANEKECPLLVCPPLKEYEYSPEVLGIPGEVQKVNASLALQLSNAWLQVANNNYDAAAAHLQEAGASCAPFQLSKSHIKGLVTCTWPGRYQQYRKGNVIYFMDGAHTAESIRTCVDWFESTSKSSNGLEPYRILLFNCTGQRSAADLILPVMDISFDQAIFSPNNAYDIKQKASDQSNFNVDRERELQITEQLCTSFLSYYNERHVETSLPTKTFSCLNDALNHITGESENKPEVHVLVTGSLLLVGGLLRLIDPNLQSFNAKTFID